MATIKEVKEALQNLTDLEDTRWQVYEEDSRKGVQAAIKTRKQQLIKEQEEDMRLEYMLRYERGLYDQGFQVIAGIDEVGRGPLAGPVVAACVVLPKDCKIRGLNDSKQIPKKKHQAIYDEVMSRALAVGIGVMDNDVIDTINIYEATKKAMLEALSKVKEQVQVDALLIDAMQLDTPIHQESLIKGDANSLSIAAASIVAKVTRDQMMADYAKTYPDYDFEHNAGYGTAKHLDGLREKGITPIHRKTFEPIKSMLK